MLNEEFIKASREYTNKVDLTAAETAALNELGKSLNLGKDFAKSFESMISNSQWRFHQRWGRNDANGNRVNAEESMIECTLYSPIEDEGFERIPKVHASYWTNNADGSKNSILDVDFVPAYLVTSSQNSGSGMHPIIRDLNNDLPDQDIVCYQSRQIVRVLRGEPLLSATLPSTPKAPEV